MWSRSPYEDVNTLETRATKPGASKPLPTAAPASPEAVIDLDAARSEAERLERRAETKRHLAALQLQTMYHHHRAEKARACRRTEQEPRRICRALQEGDRERAEEVAARCCQTCQRRFKR